MKQENKTAERVTVVLLTVAAIALLLIPLRDVLFVRVSHTFRFDNRRQALKIERVSVVGDFSDWQERFYLHDEDKDGVWSATLRLKPGWHAYRFVVNGRRWIRDWRNPYYGGAYSNSLVYVDTVKVPQWYGAKPATGSWLYRPVERLHFLFDRKIISWLKANRAIVWIDSVQVCPERRDSTLSVPLAATPEGEHTWRIELRKQDGTLVFFREGLYFVNLRNQAPQARAGHTAVVFEGDSVRLNGSTSFDPDFEPLTRIRWRQIAGPQIARLADTQRVVARAWFPQAGRYRFEVTVADSQGALDRDTTEVVVLRARHPQTVFSVDLSRQPYPVKTVALVGEFNQWAANRQPMRYDSTQGMWKTEIALPPGKWEYKFVLNGEQWIPDPQNPKRVADGWNGFNSVKIVPADSTWDGRFSEVGRTPHFLSLAFAFSQKLNQKAHWVADVQNPVKKCLQKEGTLRFDLRWPQGIYYYYWFARQGAKKCSAPRVIQIRHFEKTEWMDLQQTPAWADSAVVYELFLRRYTPQGTFKSLIARLPQLKELGINTLWLLPVYKSPTEHGYAPTSLFETNPAYGTLSAYRQLIAAAHRLKMKVVFDFVANHLSDQHPFVRAAYRNKKSPLRRWFYWKADGTWGYHNDWDTLVNLNYHTPWVRHYMLDAALFWLNVGVDGFRCDVAWAVPHDFWKTFRRATKAVNPRCLLLDEVLPRQPAFHDEEFDMSYDTDFYGNILDVLHGKKPLSAIPFGIEKSVFNYPQGAQSLRYLENHDLPRFLAQFGPKLTRVMAVVLFTVPGTPLLYYGQELGAVQQRPDYYRLKRTKWFDFYKKLIKLRQSSSSLRSGRLVSVRIDDENKIWWYRRAHGQEQTDVIVNLSRKWQKIGPVPEGKIVEIPGAKFKRLGKHTINLAGESFIIIQKVGDR